MLENNYIVGLVTPKTGTKKTARKSWSIDLEMVWLPFFTATNTVGNTAINHEALGAPLRLAVAKDGAVKFSKAGKPIIRIAKDISDNVKVVRENFVCGLQSFAHQVATSDDTKDKFIAEATANVAAGRPLIDSDTAKLAKAVEAQKQAIVNQAIEHANAQSEPETEQRELVPA